MAAETKYLVQAFIAVGRGLRAETAIPCRSAELARDRAEKLATTKAGAVAFEVTADAEAGDYGEPVILFKAGRLPPAFNEE